MDSSSVEDRALNSEENDSNMSIEDDRAIDHDETIKLWNWNIKYSTWIVKHPYLPIILVVLVCAALYAWLFAVYGITVYADTNFYRWSGDDITQKWDSYTSGRKSTYASLLDLLGQTIGMPRQFQLTQMGCVIYERPNQNILELKVMQEIWKVEDEMHAVPGWEDRCFRIPFDIIPPVLHDLVYSAMNSMKNQLSAIEDSYCIAFKSLITDIKEYMKLNLSIADPKVEDLTQQIIHDVIMTDMKRISGTYLGNDFDPDTMTTTRSRSMFPFGLPYVGYINKDDRTKEQTKNLGMWQKDFIKPIERLQELRPYDLAPYPAFPFALEFLISDVVLEQVYWLIGSFACTFIVAVFVMKSFFISILGVIGIFLPIPCAVALLHGVFTIHHLDVIDVLGLFFICGIGADGLFIIFQMFKQSYHIYNPKDLVNRLAYTNQRGLISVATALATAGISFLALCTSGVRIMRFFGVFCFLMLIFEFLFTFSFYLGIIVIWAKYWEKNQKYAKASRGKQLKNENKDFNLEEEDESSITSLDSTNEVYDYPMKSPLAFMKYRPKFKINASGLNVKELTIFERFFLYYWTPFVYHYRVLIVLVFFILSIVFGVFTFKMTSKSNLKFFDDYHPLQRAYTLALDGFSTALNDFSFVYVWGLEDKPSVSAADLMTVTDYGSPRFKGGGIDISDPDVQEYIDWAYNTIISQPFIDATLSKQMGANPMQYVRQISDLFKNLPTTEIAALDNMPGLGALIPNKTLSYLLEKFLIENPNILPTIAGIAEPLLFPDSVAHGRPITQLLSALFPPSFDKAQYQAAIKNIMACYNGSLIKIINQFITFPTEFPMPSDQFSVDEWLWQALLSMMTMSEPDSYVPGTLKANTIGFDKTNYSLRYIAVKGNMIIPPGSLTVERYRELYEKAKELEKIIDERAPPSMKGGFMTSVAWNTMITEEKLPEQVVLDVTYAFVVATIVIFICTLSPSTAIYTLYSMICTVFIIMGILYFTGWKIGTNEAIMISIAAGFSIDFIIQPLIGLKSDVSDRSCFGRLQNSLTIFSSPVSCACLTSILAAVFLYPCDVLLFPPFATFMIGSTIFGVLHGFLVIPALVGIFGPNQSDSLVEIYKRRHRNSSDELDSVERKKKEKIEKELDKMTPV